MMNEPQYKAIRELTTGKRSERVVAIVGGAILDQSLRIALELRFRPTEGKSDINKKLFDVGNSLGNLGPKIDLGFQLYMYDEAFRNTAHGLCKIRNSFAHDLDMHFESKNKDFIRAFGKLTLHINQTHYMQIFGPEAKKHKIEKIKRKSDVFVVNLKMCLLWLMADRAKHAPWTNER